MAHIIKFTRQPAPGQQQQTLPPKAGPDGGSSSSSSGPGSVSYAILCELGRDMDPHKLRTITQVYADLKATGLDRTAAAKTVRRGRAAVGMRLTV